jgi:hypothetical protein
MIKIIGDEQHKLTAGMILKKMENEYPHQAISKMMDRLYDIGIVNFGYEKMTDGKFGAVYWLEDEAELLYEKIKKSKDGSVSFERKGKEKQ